jgi:hypothetical protein
MEKYKAEDPGDGGRSGQLERTPRRRAGCPAEIRDIRHGGSLPARWRRRRGSRRDGVVVALRGFLGDVIFGGSHGVTATVMLPSRRTAGRAANLLDGTCTSRRESGAAPGARREPEPHGVGSATTSSLRTKLRGKGALTAPRRFIENSPAPVYLRSSPATGGGRASVRVARRLHGHALAFNLCRPLPRMKHLIQGASSRLGPGAGGPGCEIGFLQPPCSSSRA